MGKKERKPTKFEVKYIDILLLEVLFFGGGGGCNATSIPHFDPSFMNVTRKMKIKTSGFVVVVA